MSTTLLPTPEAAASHTPPRAASHAGYRDPERGAPQPPTGGRGGPGGPDGPTLLDVGDAPVTGFPAYATLIQVQSSSSPEAFTTIAGAGDIAGPNTTMGEVETTSHSTGAPVRSYVPSLADPGELSFPCYWNPVDPTQSIDSPFGMEALFWSRRITKFQLVAPDASHRTRQFFGFVKSIGETYPVQGVMTRNIAIRITSPLTDVAAAVNVTPASANATKAGGPGTFDVAAGGSQAPWRALPDAAWITVSAPVGESVGDDTVDYTTAANPGTTDRTGHININGLGLTFTVTQSGT